MSSPSLPSLPLDRLKLTDLFAMASRADEISWEPFREGLLIHRLYGDGLDGPSAALIRFAPGGRVPLHEHLGFEHILVLAGEQCDNRGCAGAGTLIVNPPGTRHSVVSEHGCIVLAIYERAVHFLE